MPGRTRKAATAQPVSPVLLSVPAAAARLDTSPATIYRLVHAGHLRYTPIGTGSRPVIRIHEDSLDAWIAARTVVGRRAA